MQKSVQLKDISQSGTSPSTRAQSRTAGSTSLLVSSCHQPPYSSKGNDS